jgi:hypothetical protein
VSAILVSDVRSEQFGHRVPVADHERCAETLERSTCQILQSWLFRTQLLELRYGGVEITFSEYLTAPYQVTLDGNEFDIPPLGFEACLRCAMRNLGNDSSSFAEPMHGFDMDLEVWGELPHVADILGRFTRMDRYDRSMVDQIRFGRGEFAPIERRMSFHDSRPRARVWGSFTSKEACIELGYCDNEVVGIEGNVRRNAIFTVCLDNRENVINSLVTRFAALILRPQ